MSEEKSAARAQGVDTAEDAANGSADELMHLVYRELRELARLRLAHEDSPLTLTATALVHEAYVRLQARPENRWGSPQQFFTAAARAMRHILIDRARRRQTEKHGGGRQRLELGDVAVVTEATPAAMLDLDRALGELEARDPRKSDVVHLRYFAGLTVEETARVLNISTRLVEKEWAFARAWLQSELAQT
jgi:RNA polymerase sigma factor (TIGR02999 family)